VAAGTAWPGTPHVTYSNTTVRTPDLGTNYFDEHDRQQVARRLVRRLVGLGHQVALDTLTPPASAA
jgi:hypothetical protein